MCSSELIGAALQLIDAALSTEAAHFDFYFVFPLQARREAEALPAAGRTQATMPRGLDTVVVPPSALAGSSTAWFLLARSRLVCILTDKAADLKDTQQRAALSALLLPQS